MSSHPGSWNAYKTLARQIKRPQPEQDNKTQQRGGGGGNGPLPALFCMHSFIHPSYSFTQILSGGEGNQINIIFIAYPQDVCILSGEFMYIQNLLAVSSTFRMYNMEFY